MVENYFTDRKLVYDAEDRRSEIILSCGVPRGSVLEPTLWNILYDDLLKMPLPSGVDCLAFADDVTLVATAEESYILEEKLRRAAEVVRMWLSDISLKLASQKSEAAILTCKRKHNEMAISIGGVVVQTGTSVKYLGIQIDRKTNFKEHAKIVAARAGDTMNNLSRIMPNVSAARPGRRRLLAGIVHAQLLYGSEMWADKMNEEGWKDIIKV